MKFNIAAKLGLLAAAVALLMTALVGRWSLQSARKVLTDREVANLTEEAELCSFELQNVSSFVRKDARDPARPAASYDEKMRTFPTFEVVKTLLDGRTTSGLDPAKAKERLTKQFTDLLGLKDYYLEIACVANDEARRYPTILALGRPAVGKPARTTEGKLAHLDGQALGELMKDAWSPRKQTFPVRAFRVLPAAEGDRATPMLLTVAYPVSRQTRGDLVGMLLLTIDFEEYVRSQTRYLPRHLTWLTDSDGRLVIHADPQRQQQIRLA